MAHAFQNEEYEYEYEFDKDKDPYPCNNGQIRQTSLHDLVLTSMEEPLRPSPTVQDFRNIRIERAGQLIACGPPVACPNDVFRATYPVFEEVTVREALEGTWITLFYDATMATWELATRGKLGARTWYTRLDYACFPLKRPQKTYRDMFVEALVWGGEEGEQGEQGKEGKEGKEAKEAKDLQDIALLSYLPRDVAYTFVLQHPDNPLVRAVTEPALYLDSAFVIDGDHIQPVDAALLFRDTPVRVPKVFESIKDYTAALSFFPPVLQPSTSSSSSSGVYNISTKAKPVPTLSGLWMVHPVTGARSFIKNPLFEEQKTFRGNHPNLQYQFLEIMQQRRIHEYLMTFPAFKPLFYQFHKDLVQRSHTLYGIYRKCFVFPGQRRKRTGKSEVIPRVAKHHFVLASQLHHEVYIPSVIAGTQSAITPDRVRVFLETLSPSQLIHYLNLGDEEDEPKE